MKYTVIFLTLLAIISSLHAQNVKQREREILAKNIEFYRTGRYEKAEQNFAVMITRLPSSSYYTTNYLMYTKTIYKLGKYGESIEQAKQFIELFPKSTYRDDILYVMGNSYFQLQRYGTAIKSWDRALAISDNPQLTDRLGYLISETVHYKINNNEYDELNKDISTNDGQVLLAIGFAEKQIAAGNAFDANEKLNQIIKQYPDSRFTARARDLLQTRSRGRISGRDGR